MSGTQLALTGALGSSANRLIVVVTDSTVFTAPIDGWYTFEAWGAGGSGAALQAQGSTGGIVSGGGSGGYCRKRVWLAADQIVSITVGIGGSGRTGDGNGYAGTDTTVLLSGVIDLVVPGGVAGDYTTTNGGYCGGFGASPSTGGDINRAGSGSDLLGPHVTGAMVAGGGGSAPTAATAAWAANSGAIEGTLLATSRLAFGGASITNPSSNVAPGTAAIGGGAGVGSRYGATVDKGGRNWALAAAPGINGSTTPTVSSGISLPVDGFNEQINPAKRLYGGGTDGVTAVNSATTSGTAGPGAGSGGVVQTGSSGSSATISGDAGTFGGSGGAVSGNTASATATSGKPGRAAGSGGAITYGSGVAASSPGGNGLVVIEMEIA